MFKKITFFLPIVFALALWGFFYKYEKNNFETNVQYPCVSYAPHDIVQKEKYEEKELSADLKKIKKISSCVRIYGVTGGLEQIPAIAESLGMQVIIGAWLDENMQRNNEELDNLVSLATKHKNIKYIVVGNETILMGRVDENFLFANLDRVRKLVDQPVTTTESPQVWRVYPDLQDHVDFIGLHKFPFWEEVPIEKSLSSMRDTLEDMKSKFYKPIVVLEIGWPTNGINQGQAAPGLINQRKYLRETGEYLNSEKIFYSVAEGIDVPSKLKTTEGLIGLHWGILTYQGYEKHIFPVRSLMSFILLYIVLLASVYIYNKPVIKIFKKNILYTEYIFVIAAALTASMLVLFYKLYMTVMPIFQTCFTLLAIYGFFECSHKYVQFRYAYLASEKILSGEKTPDSKSIVSIFVAAKDESSDQIILTLQSLLNQSHESVEVLYIDNNSKNKNSYIEVEKYFNQNPSAKLKLFYQEKITGFKAGALNYLLTYTDPKSRFIAVVDSDYVVEEKWIETSLLYVKEDTGFVQFPQAYSLPESAYDKKNNIEIGSTVEQRYVFDIVYPVRSFLGDIVQNGTMVLINKKYLSNGWPTYSICEDAALGIEISKQGGRSVYVPQVMGQGTAPKTFIALRKQRNRWVFGAMQILWRGIFNPKEMFSKTYVLFFLDWLGWIMQGLYPLLLVSSIGYILFLWLVYLYLQISWVMLVGFIFVFISLLLFTATYFKTYRSHKHKFLKIYSLLLIEFGLVNTISKTVLSSLVPHKVKFVTTRHVGDIRIHDLLSLAGSFLVVCIGVCLFIVLFILKIPVSIKLLGAAQLLVVMLPQFSYIWLRFRY